MKLSLRFLLLDRVLSRLENDSELLSFLPATLRFGETRSEALYWIPVSSMVLSRLARLSRVAVIRPGVRLAERSLNMPSESGLDWKRKLNDWLRRFCLRRVALLTLALELRPMAVSYTHLTLPTILLV